MISLGSGIVSERRTSVGRVMRCKRATNTKTENERKKATKSKNMIIMSTSLLRMNVYGIERARCLSMCVCVCYLFSSSFRTVYFIDNFIPVNFDRTHYAPHTEKASGRMIFIALFCAFKWAIIALLNRRHSEHGQTFDRLNRVLESVEKSRAKKAHSPKNVIYGNTCYSFEHFGSSSPLLPLFHNPMRCSRLIISLNFR